ncbi:MAG: hypothetical protein ACK47B_26895 [Armatimonadota bacterium]
MNLRERILAGALGLVAALLLGLWVWQGGRYADAQAVMREYSRLEAEIQRLEEENPERAAAMKVARAEVRRRLNRGELTEALRRIQALQAEDEADPEPEVVGKSLSTDSLWPPGSKERERMRQVLAEVSRKQEQGFDITAARDALVEVAAAARKGDRKAALERFGTIPGLLQSAPLRPGFRTAAAEDPAPAAAALPPISDQQIAQLEQAMQILPRMAEQVGPERRGVLLSVPPLVRQVIAAHRQGKDVRPLMPMVMGLRGAFQGEDTRRAERLLQQIRSMLPQLKPLPPGATTPTPPATAGSTPPPGQPQPVRPGGTPPIAMPAPGADQVLRMLDELRKMPEPQYQQRRLVMAEMIARALRGGGGPAAGSRPGQAPALRFIGRGDRLLIALDPEGRLAQLRLAGQPPPGVSGGVVVRRGDEVQPLRGGSVTQERNSLIHRLQSAAGSATTTYRIDGDLLTIELMARSAESGAAGAVEIRLPFEAEGWEWSAGGVTSAIEAGGKYLTSDADGARAALARSGVRLVLASSGGELAYDPDAKQLIARYPLAPGATALSARLELRVIGK